MTPILLWSNILVIIFVNISFDKYTYSVYFYIGGNDMDIKEMRVRLGDTQSDFSRRYNIPFRTIQNWESNINTPPSYVTELLEQQVTSDLINRRCFEIPEKNAGKKNLPASEKYRSAIEWLQAVRETLGNDIVFALDSALICGGSYQGRMNEWVVWIYGDRKNARYNGVCVIGEEIDPLEVECRNGLKYTTFNRTLNDSMANERILDMQGITEALSKYYFTHNESYDGLYSDIEYSIMFNQLKEDATDYYTY